MSHILVSGARGYVGREVVRHLLERGCQVTALGRSDPKTEVPFVQVDLTRLHMVQKALSGSYDCIMHLASLPGDTGNPQQMVQTNVNGCLNLLEFARQSRTPRFILASSVSAYEWYPATPFNPPDHLPVDEEHPCRPRDIYSVTKRIQEELAMTYFHQYGLGTTVLRLTAVVGPRGTGGGRGWGQFAEALAAGKSVQVPHFSAEEICHYVDVRDVGRMFLAAAESKGAAGQIFNCCGPSPISGTDFKKAVQDLVPGIQVEFGFPWSMAQGKVVYFSMEKAKRIMRFEPLYDLAQSLRSIKEWVDSGGLADLEKVDVAYGGGVSKSD